MCSIPRYAAFLIQAGIPHHRLTLALEPEAAAIYAKESLTQRTIGKDKKVQIQTYRPGTKYMVLDLGGEWRILNFMYVICLKNHFFFEVAICSRVRKMNKRYIIIMMHNVLRR